MFHRLLIANRGEIACRVIRTCRRMGLHTIAVYSDADAGALHVRMADEACHIGGPRPQDSYLRGDAILAATRASGAEAIHPGYGFLSENADFAEAVEAAGIAFVGPRAASMRRLGSKAGAKRLMQAAGVPVVPGYDGDDQSEARLVTAAGQIGFPLMIKAAHGGGGKGMRVVHAAEDFVASLAACRREAMNAFGRDEVLLERYIRHPRHIEFQVFGDHHGGCIHLYERDCSTQRRYQKVLEESPSPALDPAMRQAMGEAAVRAARALDYVNAGTVEFIVESDERGRARDFHFMEINTRLQVEHPVTEMTTGLDLVEWQLRIAAGEPLPLAQEAITPHGHAIEVRLYAEDPARGFLPGSGVLHRLHLPASHGNVRVDAGVTEGDAVTIHYDPMIAKLIVRGDGRDEAIARMQQALGACMVEGTASNVAFLERLLDHPALRDATLDTSTLDRQPGDFLPLAPDDPIALVAGACLAQALRAEQDERAAADAGSPWAHADGWRIGARAPRQMAWRGDDTAWNCALTGHGGEYRLVVDGRESHVECARLGSDGQLGFTLDGRALRLRAWSTATGWLLHDGRARLALALHDPRARRDAAGDTAGHVLAAPMPGRVIVCSVAPGDAVVAGQEVLVMEAMKMELALKAPRDGVIAELRAVVGDFVEADALLLRLEA
jgi:3-methylcrotonyl-CoA carboxylase alpha subunit